MHDESSSQEHELGYGTPKTYTTGFVLSLLLTFIAFFLVYKRFLSRDVLMGTLVGLALIQLFVQLHFFLNFGRESKPRWNTLLFIFMGVVVVILVFGSLWIMHNLNYRMMPMGM